MPLYGYRCSSCKQGFDRLQKLSEPDPTQCPACGAATVARELSAPSIRLAGTGWYETDFKGKSEPRRNLADAPAPTGKPPSA